MSPLSMSQRAEPGPIYKVSWPEGSRLSSNMYISFADFHFYAHIDHSKIPG